MNTRIGRVAVLGAVLTMFVSVGVALAHEERTVGDYGFVVGFIDEPVYTGQKSGLELMISQADTPVEGLEETLQATVTFGEETRDLPLEPRFGEPGWYESVFFPTAAGPYTFRIFGDIDGHLRRRIVHVQPRRVQRGAGGDRWPVPGHPAGSRRHGS